MKHNCQLSAGMC